jgi:hypothetical protein
MTYTYVYTHTHTNVYSLSVIYDKLPYTLSIKPAAAWRRPKYRAETCRSIVQCVRKVTVHSQNVLEVMSRASTQVWTCLILFANTFCRSAFGKSLCTYKRYWKWCPRASMQIWYCLILFANTFCRSACEIFMYAVIAVFNSLRVRGRSRNTADFAAAVSSGKRLGLL